MIFDWRGFAVNGLQLQGTCEHCNVCFSLALGCGCNVERGNVIPTKRGVRNADPETRRQTAVRMAIIFWGGGFQGGGGGFQHMEMWRNRYVA